MPLSPVGVACRIAPKKERTADVFVSARRWHMHTLVSLASSDEDHYARADSVLTFRTNGDAVSASGSALVCTKWAAINVPQRGRGMKQCPEILRSPRTWERTWRTWAGRRGQGGRTRRSEMDIT